MRAAWDLAVDWADARRDHRGTALITYLTTDPKVLGILAWASSAITLLGFGFAICQIRKVKRSADAARDAALGLAHRVRSRELLAKLGDAHTHLEVARNHVARGQRDLAVLCLELSCGSMIEAQEIAHHLLADKTNIQVNIVLLRQLTEQIATMSEPLSDDVWFVQLQIELREASEILRKNMAHSRYTYDLNEA